MARSVVTAGHLVLRSVRFTRWNSIAPVRRRGHHLRLHAHRRGDVAGRGVADRTIGRVLDLPSADGLRGRAGRQRRRLYDRIGVGRGRSVGSGFTRRQRTEASAVGAAAAGAAHHAGEGHAAAASAAHAAGAAAVAAAAAHAAGAERAAAIAEDGAGTDRAEGVVLANAELGAAAATAFVITQAEAAAGERLRRQDARNNQGQHSGRKQFFHDGGSVSFRGEGPANILAGGASSLIPHNYTRAGASRTARQGDFARIQRIVFRHDE
jgi:hypothetical protein